MNLTFISTITLEGKVIFICINIRAFLDQVLFPWLLFAVVHCRNQWPTTRGSPAVGNLQL